ncbi:hypothetical protein COLO4_37533 [Corchorus olitorius]|uniref:Uncharacterized protein n=1 Tax=Corchorus olitorius TaxID=93759 RepID=A0A1R3G112_9ROSI|nr:hypothetical protein COLO4_37533 [Corchorus olitorius]
MVCGIQRGSGDEMCERESGRMIRMVRLLKMRMWRGELYWVSHPL